MIRFFMTRYMQNVSKHRTLLFIALIPPLAYLVYAALLTDRFMILQDIRIAPAAPIAVSVNPVDTIPLSEIAKQPQSFFMDKFVMKEIAELLSPMPSVANDRPASVNYETLASSMSMSILPENKLKISYYGPDRTDGTKLVEFFAARLIRKSKEGNKRSQMQNPGAAVHSAAVLDSPLQVQAERALMRSNRIIPAVSLLAATLAVVLLWFALAEWMDRSFKSERQAAHYLQIQTLGSLPNLNDFSRTIGYDPSA